MFASRNMIFAGQLDADVLAFKLATGATDLAAHSALTNYLKGESLYNDCRWASFKSAQANGSGSTVNCLGGWTANNFALVSSPPWGADSMAFTAAGDYAYIDLTGFQSLSAGMVMTRFKPANNSTIDGTAYNRWLFGDSAAGRYLALTSATGSLSGETLTTYQENNSNPAGDRSGSSTATWSAGDDFTEVAKFGTFGTNAGLWKDDTATTIDLTSGSQVFTPAATGYTVNDRVYLSATNSSGVTASQTGSWIVQFFCRADLTDTQREAIRGLIANF